jgi:hypothetical protein
VSIAKQSQIKKLTARAQQGIFPVATAQTKKKNTLKPKKKL